MTRAGWAQTDITPPLGLPMGGRGPHSETGVDVRDPLYAHTLVIEDASGTRTLWVSVDLIGFALPMATRLQFELSAATGIPMDAIVLNGSHTHSGPTMYYDAYATSESKPTGLVAYELGLIHRIAAAAVQAVESLHPVTVTYRQGTSEVGMNRRRKVGNDVAMRPNPDGHYNRDLWVLNLRGRDERDRCVVFTYACHPVMVVRIASRSISADFPGECRERLHAALGESVHCQFMQSATGNVRPRCLADLDAGRFRHATPEDLAAAGQQLADDVVAALEGGGEPLELDLAFATGWCDLSRDQSSILEPIRARAGSENPKKRAIGRYWLDRIEHGPPLTQSVPWPVGLIRLTAEHWIVHLGGEPVAEWLAHLRRWLAPRRLICWGYCQAHEGYLPTDELLPEGGYEVSRANYHFRRGPGPFAAGINESMRRKISELVERIS